MGPAVVDPAVVSIIDALPNNWISHARAICSPRTLVANLARHVASVHSLAPPEAFAHDPACPLELAAHLELVGEPQCTPDLLGVVWEVLLAPDEKRAQGAHFTPRPVAERLVELTLAECADIPRTVWDPSCGGGAFLLAAVRAIEARSRASRRAIVEGVFASDIDETALAVCDATLELWSGSSTRPTVHCGDALLDLPATWPSNVDLIVGNPPFLGQLTSDTARGTERRATLTREYASVATGYVDDAGLFLELAVRRAADEGAIGLILPESILGARDAEATRRSAQESFDLRTLWVDEGQSFAAAVDVVGVVLAAGTSHPRSQVVRGWSTPPIEDIPEPASQSWAPLLADALGVPRFVLGSGPTVGDWAEVTAGFRQHFYGIAQAVSNGEPSIDSPQLMTSGTIDPLQSTWGVSAVRFAGSRWNNPVLDIAAIEDAAVRAWFGDRCVPKVLLASQTRVVEAVVDDTGQMVPSVPVVSVEPHEPTAVWHLAAALSSPAVTAWILREAAGTGLSHDAVRLRAKTLARVPLPSDQTAWDLGALHAEAAQTAVLAGDDRAYIDALRDLAMTMGVAYGIDEAVGAWWWERLRLPEGFQDTPY